VLLRTGYHVFCPVPASTLGTPRRACSAALSLGLQPLVNRSRERRPPAPQAWTPRPRLHAVSAVRSHSRRVCLTTGPGASAPGTPDQGVLCHLRSPGQSSWCCAPDIMSFALCQQAPLGTPCRARSTALCHFVPQGEVVGASRQILCRLPCPSASGPLVNSPGRTRVVLVKRCRAQTARAANPWALRPSLMAGGEYQTMSC